MMIEIILCSREASNWVEELDVDQDYYSINIPCSFGLTIENAIKRRIKECANIKEFKESNPIGFLLAKSGIRFPSKDLISSVTHALACASDWNTSKMIDIANEIDSFVFGNGVYSKEIPVILAKVGVYSILKKNMSLEFAKWMKSIKRENIITEVSEMHGIGSIDTYLNIADSLFQIFSSVDIHGSDLCCKIP